MKYRVLELGLPGRQKCPDEFDDASTLLCPKSSRLLLQISKQAVMIQLGVMEEGQGSALGSVEWGPEMSMLPIIASLGRTFDAVRVRNLTKGQEAQVVLGVD